MYDIQSDMNLEEKLKILSDAAKYDVACTSSGVSRQGKKGYLGNSVAAGICHSFGADGRCISLLKILMTNHCAYDCKYCQNRCSNDIVRATFTPDEICHLTIEFYKRNYIEGLFLSSGVLGSPNNTMELMCIALRKLRTEYKFNGYIHVKAIPGASKELIYSAGLLADRISINMELPTEESLSRLAPNKPINNILRPMSNISNTIASHRLAIGKSARFERGSLSGRLVGISDDTSNNFLTNKSANRLSADKFNHPAELMDEKLKRPFAPAGQSTQMIIGASGERDIDILRTTQSLYRGFDLKRVFFSAYIPLNKDEELPDMDTPVPLLREHRLYQADWLLRYYGFEAEELLTEENPYFDNNIDPKCEWAIRNIEKFPIEINTASAEMLLRVPGIGPTGVRKIISARRYGAINFEMLKKMRITLKRAQYFITCSGKMLYKIPLEQTFIRNRIADLEQAEIMEIKGETLQCSQMNLFSDFKLAN